MRRRNSVAGCPLRRHLVHNISISLAENGADQKSAPGFELLSVAKVETCCMHARCKLHLSRRSARAEYFCHGVKFSAAAAVTCTLDSGPSFFYDPILYAIMHAVVESLFFSFRRRVCSARSRHVSYWAENPKQPEFCINLLFTAPYFRVGPARIKIQRSVQLRSLRPQRKQLHAGAAQQPLFEG